MMKPYPELQTDRLILREFAVEDATSVQRLASEWKEPVSRCSSPTPTRTGNGRGVARYLPPPPTSPQSALLGPLSVVNES